MAWFGFWIFMAVLVACEAYLHSQGMDTFFWGFKTDKEKEIQEAIIRKKRG